jgi:putative ABC transport system permease protein
LGQRSAHRPLAAWFWADSRQQLSGLSLALMALLLALAVNVGVGTMVESFSRTFISWLDGRLRRTSISDASDSAGDRHQELAARAPEVEAILPGGRADTHYAGAPIEVLGLPIIATYREQLAAARSAHRTPGSGFVPATLPRQRTIVAALKLAIGDRIEVPASAATGRWRSSASMPTTATRRPDRGQLSRLDAALSGSRR